MFRALWRRVSAIDRKLGKRAGTRVVLEVFIIVVATSLLIVANLFGEEQLRDTAVITLRLALFGSLVVIFGPAISKENMAQLLRGVADSVDVGQKRPEDNETT